MLSVLALTVGAAVEWPHDRSQVPAVSIAHRQIRSKDIASGSPDDEAIVLSLPARANEVVLSEAQRRQLLRNRFPSGRFTLRHQGPLRLVRQPSEEAVPQRGSCFAAGIDIMAETPVSPADLALVACQREGSGHWLRYDARSRTHVARLGIAAGTYLGAVRVREPSTVAAGASLVYRTYEGPVTIEREVVALQPGRAGKELFARTSDGAVLVATLRIEGDE